MRILDNWILDYTQGTTVQILALKSFIYTLAFSFMTRFCNPGNARKVWKSEAEKECWLDPENLRLAQAQWYKFVQMKTTHLSSLQTEDNSMTIMVK
jgi:hypothetical protein